MTGAFKRGYDADVIVVAGDPTSDINALVSLRAVYTKGRPFTPDPVRAFAPPPSDPGPLAAFMEAESQRRERAKEHRLFRG